MADDPDIETAGGALHRAETPKVFYQAGQTWVYYRSLGYGWLVHIFWGHDIIGGSNETAPI